jgi:hypothetical protein
MGLRFDVEVALALGADLTADPSTWSWTDVTAYAMLTDGGVSITRGRSPEQTQTPPSSCTLRVNNADGRFARLNPLGAYYPQLRKNTPLRVRVGPAGQLIRDTFTRTETDGWGTPDRGAAWTLTGTAANFDVAAGVGTIVGDAGGEWATTATFTDVDVTVRVKASTLNGEVVVVARFTDGSNHYSFEIDLDSGSQSIDIFVYDAGTPTQLATAAFTAVADTWYRMRAQCQGTALRLKVWDDGDAEPSAWDLETTDATHTSGSVGCGAFNATGVKSFDDFEAHPVGGVRFVGYTAGWPTRWTHGQKHQWVPVRADGVLRRLVQGKPDVRSSLRRSLASTASSLSTGLAAYWPLEEVRAATTARSVAGAVATVPVPGRAVFGEAGPAGTAGAVRLITGDPVVGVFNDNRPAMTLPLPATDTGDLTLGLWVKASIEDTAGADGSADSLAVIVVGTLNFSSGTIRSVRVLLTETVPGTSSRQSYVSVIPNTALDATGTDLTEINSFPAGPRILDGAWHQIQVRLSQDGADVDYELYVDGTLEDSTTETTQTLGATLELKLATSGSVTNASDGLDTGNATVTVAAVTTHGNVTVDAATLYDAGVGYPGETDVDRFNRVCTEQGIPHVTATGDGIQLGPQPVAGAVDVLLDGEATGQGLLYEALTGQLAYQPVSARYNLPVSLALDHDQGHIVAPFEPADDDLLIRNDITVANSNTGISATATDDDSIESGHYPDDPRLNLYTDDQAALIAGHRLLHGTVDDEYRYPTVVLALHKSTDLVADWLAVDLTDRLTIDNLPADVTPDLVDQSLDAYAERVSSVAYDVAGVLSPYRPYRVQQLTETPPDDDVLDGWLIPDSMTVDADFDAGTDTSMDVDVTPAITTSADDMPLRIRTSGVLLEVTAVGAPSGTVQTLTVTQTPLNGVVKTITTGTAVDLEDPIIPSL